MVQWVSSAWSIQTGPFAPHLTKIVVTISQLMHFHTGEPILITPEGQFLEKGILKTPDKNGTAGFQCLEHSN